MNRTVNGNAPGRAGRRAARRGAAGLTLLELVVALALVGLALALSAPSIPRAPAPADPIQAVLDRASRTAVRRAQWLELIVGSDGRWSLEAPGRDDPALLSGRLDAAPITPMRVRISPLGACWPAPAADRRATAALDPVRCRRGATRS